MKNLAILILTLTAFSANAAFTNSGAVSIPKLSCQKTKDKSFVKGNGGSAYNVDWTHDFCENVSARFRAANEIVRHADGSFKGTYSVGIIEIHKPIRFQILTKNGLKAVAVQPGKYGSGLDGGWRSASGQNIINVKPTNRSYMLQLSFNGKNENAVMGWLRVSFLVDGRLKHYFFDCKTSVAKEEIATAAARPSVLKRK